jgi:hypothetical protein
MRILGACVRDEDIGTRSKWSMHQLATENLEINHEEYKQRFPEPDSLKRH